ncbi:MFS quinate transporter QutD [Cryptococcus deuterogattii 99/473]|uniref:Unplaced genomic scaffold supercont1.12, whole genome shotgun sequence n=1 Tax=Cryptococcus deuterogattii Ram5 TaxID=1296110 RepID=A0A0D0T0K2_9TREE|nr:MFS quinate transporter QutD [Cryptococcus deuterogattii Ram5]KIY57610.1 MFS quinate transporter QutD [Cryptococcus deuterogattii 99/473]
MAWKITEDRPTPTQVYNWRLYITALLIAWGAITFGYDGAFMGTTIARSSFKAYFGLDTLSSGEYANVSSNVTSCFQAAAFFGAAFSWALMESYGRRLTLQISTVIFIVGAILQTCPPRDLSYIYAGRSLCGLAVGGITGTVPAYISELSVPSIRGRLTGLFEIAYQLGSLVGFWVNYGVSEHIDLNSDVTWRLPMGIQLIPAGILMAGSFFLKESPLFYMKQDEDEKALSVLTYLRNLPEDHPYIQEEISLYRERILHERAVVSGKPGLWGYLRGAGKAVILKGIRNRMGLAFIMFALQNFSGANAINYYSPTLFGSLGITDVNLYTGIYGLVKAVGSIIFYVYFIDMWGRRQPWMVSSVACALCLTYIGAYVKIGHPADQDVISHSTKQGGTAATTLIMFYSVFWSFGANGLPWIVTSEIYPLGLRGLCGAYAAMCQWLWQFVITKSTPEIFLAMGWGTWIFFAACLMLSAVWAFFFLPETKGLRLDEMDALFGFTGQEGSEILHPDSVHDPQARKLEPPSHDEDVSLKKLEEV